MSSPALATQPSLRRLVRDTLPSDLLNFWSSQLHPLWSVDQALAQVVGRQISAEGSVTLTLKTNRHVQMPKAGQHMAVRAQVNGVWVERSYSPSVLSDRPKHLSITIKQVEGGKLSTWLTQQAKIGDIVQLGSPFGALQLPQDQRPIVLLAAGSGITPMISLLRAWQQQPDARPIQLRYWVSRREQACFVEELLCLQQIQPNFSFQLYLTQERAIQAHEQQSRIHAEQFADLSDLDQSHVLACGSADFVQTAQASLPNVHQWQIEAFAPPVQSIAVSDQQVTVTLQRQQRTLHVPIGQSILSALEAAGIAHPSGCRMGLCNTCACAKLSGTTEHLIDRHQQHDADSALRVCVSTAKTDLVLDL
ncbi:MAG: iron-sulfur cluster-binding domain-containing protein [Pseudomonadota bacterium]|nr:iron-sulfur cluster-binding domain-containing protein [Pseudomonadota bacterium]